MATMAPYSRSTLRQSVDRNVVTASPEERTSVWSSLDQRLERYPFTPLVPAEIQKAGTTWIRQCFTLAESSSQVGSHLTRYGRILNLPIILGKSCIHDNLISLRFLCVLCVSAVLGKARPEKPQRRRERRGNAEMPAHLDEHRERRFKTKLKLISRSRGFHLANVISKD